MSRPDRRLRRFAKARRACRVRRCRGSRRSPNSPPRRRCHDPGSRREVVALKRGQSCFWTSPLGPQTTALMTSCCGGTQFFRSLVAVSANPTTWPRLLSPVASLLLPPSVGSAVITPFCQRKPYPRFCPPRKGRWGNLQLRPNSHLTDRAWKYRPHPRSGHECSFGAKARGCPPLRACRGRL